MKSGWKRTGLVGFSLERLTPKTPANEASITKEKAMFDRKSVLESSAATAMLEIVQRRGFAMPKELQSAREVLAKIDELAKEAEPLVPQLPRDAARVDKVLADAAEARTRAAGIRAVAAEMREQATASVNAAVLAAGVDWCNQLANEFKEHLDVLRKLAPGAPRVDPADVSLLNPDQFAAWSAVTNATLGMEAIARDRASFAALLSEPRASHWGSTLPLIAAVAPPNGDSAQVSSGFRERIEIKEVMAVTDAATRWRLLLDLENRGWLVLSLAPGRGLVSRISLIDAWPSAFQLLSYPDGRRDYERLLISCEQTWELVGV
jgi:hypothetical protein